MELGRCLGLLWRSWTECEAYIAFTSPPFPSPLFSSFPFPSLLLPSLPSMAFYIVCVQNPLMNLLKCGALCSAYKKYPKNLYSLWCAISLGSPLLVPLLTRPWQLCYKALCVQWLASLVSKTNLFLCLTKRYEKLERTGSCVYYFLCHSVGFFKEIMLKLQNISLSIVAVVYYVAYCMYVILCMRSRAKKGPREEILFLSQRFSFGHKGNQHMQYTRCQVINSSYMASNFHLLCLPTAPHFPCLYMMIIFV